MAVSAFIWMKMHRIFAARLLSIVFGLGFAAGVSALVRGMTGSRGWLIALVMGLLASLTSCLAISHPTCFWPA